MGASVLTRIVAESIRAAAKGRRLSERTAAGASGLAAVLSCGSSDALTSQSLDRHRLVGCGDQATVIGSRIVYKLPLVIFFLLVELANRRLLADAGDADNRTAANDLAIGT